MLFESRKTIRILIILLGVTTIIGCGGGDGGETAGGGSSNAAPTVNAGENMNVDSGSTVTLSGSASDSDGTITSTEWSQISGEAVTLSDTSALNPTFTAPSVDAEITLSFRLTASDNDGATNTDSVSILVEKVNELPIADAGSDQTVDPNVVVSLSGIASDVDGEVVKYEWIQQPVATVTLSNADSSVATFVSPSSPTESILTFLYRVTDNDGGQATDTVEILVKGTNTSPQVYMGDDLFVALGRSVEIQPEIIDADGDFLTYEWTLHVPQGSASTFEFEGSSGNIFTPDIVGEYLVDLTVSDSLSRVTETLIVTVSGGKISGRNDYQGNGQEAIARVNRRAGIFDTVTLSAIAGGEIYEGNFGRHHPDDIPVTGDFDGDGVWDIAIRRPFLNTWFFKLSTNSSEVIEEQFGNDSQDIPVLADYDGDGKTDLAVWSPSSFEWRIKNSGGIDPIGGNEDGISTVVFGTAGDLPVTGDFDGDGRGDIAIRRPSENHWYIANSSGIDRYSGNTDGISAINFGNDSDDLPVSGDFDGDGITDLAILIPSTQTWMVKNSSGTNYNSEQEDGIQRVQLVPDPVFHLGSNYTSARDKPIVLDFDDDGVDDFVVNVNNPLSWLFQDGFVRVPEFVSRSSKSGEVLVTEYYAEIYSDLEGYEPRVIDLLSQTSFPLSPVELKKHVERNKIADLNSTLNDKGIKDIGKFLDLCPESDPATVKISDDFVFRRNGVLLNTNIPCQSPMSHMELNENDDLMRLIQAFRVIYYMEQGAKQSYPWTDLTLYDWMKSQIVGVNLDTDTNESYCCVEYSGENGKYIVIKSQQALYTDDDKTDYEKDSLRNSIRSASDTISVIGLLAHEVRHVEGPGHINVIYDRDFDLSNIGSYGVHWWMHNLFFTKQIDVGLGCEERSEVANFLKEQHRLINGNFVMGKIQGNAGYRNRILADRPDVVPMPLLADFLDECN